MLESIIWILLIGFFVGQVARRLKIPALVGMIFAGIILGPQAADMIAPEILESATFLRMIAVMVILMKAGLGLDREKISQQGTVAIRLGFLPAACEAIALAFASMWLLHFDFLTGLLLGCIIGAESPAVIVPGMLRLKSLGWGVAKGIPDAILTGSALSDVLLLLIFSLLLTFLSQANTTFTLPGGFILNPWQILPIQIILQIILGVLLGWITAKILVSLLSKQNWTQNTVQDTLIVASFALLLVVMSEHFPIFSGYLAVMATGFFLIELDAPLARRLRSGFDSLWTVAEIILFVLLGATIQLNILGNNLFIGSILLAIGTLIGRSLGWYLSTMGSNWTTKERYFLLAGNSAKATVQATIGAIPLAQGIAGGETILAIAALSILVTAPLGAWAIPTFAPRLLEKGEIDPTKIAIAGHPLFLAAVDGSPLTSEVLTKVADLARRTNGDVIVLYVDNIGNPQIIKTLEAESQRLLSDVSYQFLCLPGVVPEEIVKIAEERQVTDIIMGKRGHQLWEDVLIGSVSQGVLENSTIPVILVEHSGNF
jgi:NhaP-type Na+/H+ or K+/H+ antiporter